MNANQSIFTLDNFEGPLSFLLHLVQKNEIDIYEIPVKKIIMQYTQAKVNPDEDINLEAGAEFIGITSFLLWYKSKMLLPKHEQTLMIEPEQEEDPNFEIIHHLIDYCRFKDAAKELSGLESRQEGLFTRGIDIPEIKKPFGIEHLSLQDLAILFQGVMSRIAHQKGVIHEEEWKISDKISLIKTLLNEVKKVQFEILFASSNSRIELIVIFLAILEMMKLGALHIVREIETGTITVIGGNSDG